ncbi:MAG: hypothetical protein A2X05_16950 [Bacteroidetes bacterium GWE2_41_25]|nr:MAG: hypothetical protein A2X03_17945 [Bacteroidetes bacterium GWA2_40_15]OFX82604.1 MAG: hypothetical protein A2X06_07920 [Bacteroidetes bacterium GWC2_40_22]OFY11626.1 MAG: hypothetical protein A2X05_16950 [Bacteroidetes bacterium GWE2_41_25]OFY62060.1 MAG: hypothetical protein A2X04_14825 [Bacteroidetes bacterium GWF2_41_9]
MDECIFYDCSAESPKGRRSLCYDREGLESRKEHKPENNAIDLAAAMGIELLREIFITVSGQLLFLFTKKQNNFFSYLFLTVLRIAVGAFKEIFLWQKRGIHTILNVRAFRQQLSMCAPVWMWNP